MGGFLKQSTAAVIPFGVFVDKTDGVTLEVGAGIITSIDHVTTGIFLSKNGGAGAIRHQNVTASVLDAYGMFLVTLDTTDTNTVGRLRVMMAEAATFLPVYDDFIVLPANVFDSLMGTDSLDVNIISSADIDFTATQLANISTDADIALAVWAAVTRTLSAGTNIALAKGTGITGFNDVSSADVNAACDTAITDAAIPAAVLGGTIEGTTTLIQSLRLVMSALFGKISGAPSGPIAFRDIGDTKDRITATVDADGNRLTITKDAT